MSGVLPAAFAACVLSMKSDQRQKVPDAVKAPHHPKDLKQT
jgi:hypothetical protein